MIDIANQDMAFLLVALCSATAGAAFVFAIMLGMVRKSRDLAKRLGAMANWWRNQTVATTRMVDEARAERDWWLSAAVRANYRENLRRIRDEVQNDAEGEIPYNERDADWWKTVE